MFGNAKTVGEGIAEGLRAAGEAAAFDTRFDKPVWLTGSAAKEIARRLDSKGYEVVGSQSFFVRATGGPLGEGEPERAVAWGS